MRPRYCCNPQLYEDYYLSQTGKGYFSGSQRQLGYGLGNIFASLGRSVLPLVKRGAKSIGKEVLKSGTNFVSDILEGKNLKQAALNRTKETGSNLLRKVTTFPGERKRIKKTTKRKKKSSSKAKRAKTDIFS